MNLAESQIITAYQVLNFANPLYTMADNFGLVKRALRPEATQGPDEVDGNLVHLLRHPHGKRGAAGGQDRAESTACGLLKRKHAQGKVLSRGN